MNTEHEDDFYLEEALKRGEAFIEVLKKRPPLELQDYSDEVGCMTNGWNINKEEIC